MNADVFERKYGKRKNAVLAVRVRNDVIVEQPDNVRSMWIAVVKDVFVMNINVGNILKIIRRLGARLFTSEQEKEQKRGNAKTCEKPNFPSAQSLKSHNYSPMLVVFLVIIVAFCGQTVKGFACFCCD